YFGAGFSGAVSSTNAFAIQLTEPSGALTASQPLFSSRSTITTLPRLSVPVSGKVSLGPARTITSASVTVARYATGSAADARDASNTRTTPTSVVERMRTLRERAQYA